MGILRDGMIEEMKLRNFAAVREPVKVKIDGSPAWRQS
jgi:hypothetical protein